MNMWMLCWYTESNSKSWLSILILENFNAFFDRNHYSDPLIAVMTLWAQNSYLRIYNF